MRIRGKQWGTEVVILMLLGLTSVLAAKSDSSRTKTILVFGDSLSDGFMLPRTQAYPALLISKLRAAGLDYEVINASQSGGTTEDGLHRLGPHLRKPVDIFLLELGINDAFQGVPVPEIEKNLQTLIDRVRAKNPDVRVVISGMQLPDYSTDDYVGRFGQMYVDLAEKNHATLLPYLLFGVGGNPALNLPDHIHPNAAGQRVLAENVWKVLEPVAREVAGKRRSTNEE